MGGDILYEHAVPTAAILVALLLSVLLVLFLFWRYLAREWMLLGILGLRLAFLGLLAWCLFMPVEKRRVSEALRPKLLIALDTSASMKLAPSKGGAPARIEVARRVLRQPWVRDLAARCDVDVFPFAADVGARVGVSDALGLDPAGTGTRLRDALRQVSDRHRGQPLVGLVLLSDGLDTREARDGWTAEPWPCPIHTVRLEPEGAWELEADVRVDAVDTPRRVVMGWDTKLTAIVSGQGTKGQTMNVQLFKNDAMVQEMPTQIPAEGGTREVSFPLQNPVTGQFTYRVQIPPLAGEKQTNDNSYAVSVQVVDAKNRLLYIEDVPRFESKYFIRALNQNKNVSPLAFVRGPGGKFLTYGARGDMNLDMTAEQLLSYKVVVLGDVDQQTLTDRRGADLLKFVESGGSLVLLGGQKAWGESGFAAGPMQKLLPVKRAPNPVEEGKFPVVVTDEGLAHPAFMSKEGASDWDRMPPVLSIFSGATPTPGAITLVAATTPAGRQPLLVTHRYGQGKVVVVMTDSLWRWSLEPGLATNPYFRFWNQLLQWLAPEQQDVQKYSVDLFANTDRLYLGDPIDLNARVSGPAGAPVEPDKVTCEITAPDGRKVPFAMLRQAVSAQPGAPKNAFGLSFTGEAAGLYRAAAVTEIDGTRVESAPYSFYIRAFNAESYPRPLHAELLKALAGASGGAFSEPEDMDKVMRAVTIPTAEEERVTYRSLWNTIWVIGALVGLLTVEWVWRRLRNLA